MTATCFRRSTLFRFLPFLLLAALLGNTGCTPKEEPIRDYISLHAYSWESTLGSMEDAVEVAPGRKAYLRRIPLVSSHQITRIDTYDSAGGKGICCFLNDHGQMLWRAAQAEFNGHHVVLMIDGQFRSFVRVNNATDGKGAAFCIDGPFAEDDARRMSENAQRIYVKKHKLGLDTWKIDP